MNFFNLSDDVKDILRIVAFVVVLGVLYKWSPLGGYPSSSHIIQEFHDNMNGKNKLEK